MFAGCCDSELQNHSAISCALFFIVYICVTSGSICSNCKHPLKQGHAIIAAVWKTSCSYFLELSSDEVHGLIYAETNEIQYNCPRAQDQDGLLSSDWFYARHKWIHHSLIILMKAFFWQKIRATRCPEVDYCISSAICSAACFQPLYWLRGLFYIKMELLFNPFDNLVCILLGISFTVWFTLLLVFIIVPAILGVSFGIRRLYMKSLLKIFEVRNGYMQQKHKVTQCVYCSFF